MGNKCPNCGSGLIKLKGKYKLAAQVDSQVKES